jgi:hypothetical protein
MDSHWIKDQCQYKAVSIALKLSLWDKSIPGFYAGAGCEVAKTSTPICVQAPGVPDFTRASTSPPSRQVVVRISPSHPGFTATPGTLFALAIRISKAVLKLRLGSSTDKLVLLVLADHANEFGQCHPGIALLSQEADLTPRAINKSLNRLKAAGHIEVIHRHRRSNLFTLNVVPTSLNLVPVRGEPGSRYPEPRSLRTIRDPSSEPLINLRSEIPLETAVDKIESKKAMDRVREQIKRFKSV